MLYWCSPINIVPWRLGHHSQSHSSIPSSYFVLCTGVCIPQRRPLTTRQKSIWTLLRSRCTGSVTPTGCCLLFHCNSSSQYSDWRPCLLYELLSPLSDVFSINPMSPRNPVSLLMLEVDGCTVVSGFTQINSLELNQPALQMLEWGVLYIVGTVATCTLQLEAIAQMFQARLTCWIRSIWTTQKQLVVLKFQSHLVTVVCPCLHARPMQAQEPMLHWHSESGFPGCRKSAC